MFELHRAKNSVSYLQACGDTAFLSDDFALKWSSFVEENSNNDFTMGIGLDETMQIALMIKSNISPEEIGKVMSVMPSHATVMSYLSGLVPSDVLFEIDSNISAKPEVERFVSPKEDIDCFDESIDEMQRVNAACRMMKKGDALFSLPYWEECGKVIFGEEMSEKWSQYVREKVSSDYDCRSFIPATLQLATMLKAGVPTEEVRDILAVHNDREVVLFSLGEFIHPEIMEKITPKQNNY